MAVHGVIAHETAARQSSGCLSPSGDERSTSISRLVSPPPHFAAVGNSVVCRSDRRERKRSAARSASSSAFSSERRSMARCVSSAASLARSSRDQRPRQLDPRARDLERRAALQEIASTASSRCSPRRPPVAAAHRRPAGRGSRTACSGMVPTVVAIAVSSTSAQSARTVRDRPRPTFARTSELESGRSIRSGCCVGTWRRYRAASSAAARGSRRDRRQLGACRAARRPCGLRLIE